MEFTAESSMSMIRPTKNSFIPSSMPMAQTPERVELPADQDAQPDRNDPSEQHPTPSRSRSLLDFSDNLEDAVDDVVYDRHDAQDADANSGLATSAIPQSRANPPISNISSPLPAGLGGCWRSKSLIFT